MKTERIQLPDHISTPKPFFAFNERKSLGVFCLLLVVDTNSEVNDFSSHFNDVYVRVGIKKYCNFFKAGFSPRFRAGDNANLVKIANLA
ncbi:hypothetical protein J2T56_002508 [Natronobacillus azotifigens]